MAVTWPIRVTYCSRFLLRSRSPGLPRSSSGFAAAAAGSRNRRAMVVRSPRVQESGRAPRAEARAPAWRGESVGTRRSNDEMPGRLRVLLSRARHTHG